LLWLFGFYISTSWDWETLSEFLFLLPPFIFKLRVSLIVLVLVSCCHLLAGAIVRGLLDNDQRQKSCIVSWFVILRGEIPIQRFLLYRNLISRNSCVPPLLFTQAIKMNYELVYTGVASQWPPHCHPCRCVNAMAFKLKPLKIQGSRLSFRRRLISITLQRMNFPI
jgi:hypothetical protein